MGYEALIRGPQGTRSSGRPCSSPSRTRTRWTSSSRRCASRRSSRSLPRAVGDRAALRQRLGDAAAPPGLPRRAQPRRDQPQPRRRRHRDLREGDGPRLRLVPGGPGHRARAKMQIAIDDAGSGYSGLETILHLRPTTSRSPTRSCGTSTTTRSSARSSEPRWMRSEGASAPRSSPRGSRSNAERKALVELGIEFGQGYLLGKPAFQVSGRAPRLASP